MRDQILIRSIYLSILLPILLSWIGGNMTGSSYGEPALSAVPGCAGIDTNLDICTFCSEVSTSINLLNSLNGNPRTGGSWQDLDGAGVDLGDPLQVELASLAAGSYRFRYSITSGGGCPDDAATLTLNLTNIESLGCIDTINATLNDDCLFVLTANEVLAGESTCDDLVEVRAFDNDTGFSGDILTGDLAGQILDVVAFFPDCDRPICNSTIRIADVNGPMIDSVYWLPDSIDLICHDLELLLRNEKTWNDPDYKYYLGGPIINECSGFRINVIDNVFYPDCDTFFAKLSRRFVITDNFGNFSDTTLCAFFDYIDPDQASRFEDVVIDDCTPSEVMVPPTYPFVINAFGDTVHLSDNGCNYSIGFEDTEFDVCGFSRKIERHIKFFNWCTDEVENIDTLVIKLGDFVAPEIINNTDTFDLPSSPFQCGTSIGLTEVQLERTFGIEIEDCNRTITAAGELESYLPNFNFVDSSFQEGPSINNGFHITNIPIGLHRLILTLSDGCKAETMDTIYFRVKDTNPPIMSCIDRLNVSMSEGPYGKVSFFDINEGSSDNCEIINLKVRRKILPEAYENYDYDNDGEVLGDELDSLGFTKFDDPRTSGEFVDFFCVDLKNPEHEIELWAWDKGGNPSNCSTNIYLEDKLAPRCEAPKDTVMACYDFDKNNLTVLGLASPGFETCSVVDLEELAPIEEMDQCGAGVMFRRFRATKNKGTNREQTGPLCIQTVIVQPIHDYTICFPIDVSASCGADPSIPSPSFDSRACELFAVDIEDNRFEASNEECYKLLRTYSIINWCEYKGEADPVIISRNVDRDSLPGNDTICVIVERDQTVYLDQNKDYKDTIPNLKGYWINSQEDRSLSTVGFWRYTQHIKVFDDTAPEISFDEMQQFPSYTENSDEACTGAVRFQFKVEETCDTFVSFRIYADEFDYGFNYLEVPADRIEGSFPEFIITGDYPVGRHSFILEIDDGCGNRASYTMPFEVVDIYAPAPICANIINVGLGLTEEDGNLKAFGQIHADAFLSSPIYDCTGQGDKGLVTEFSINLSGDSVIQSQKILEFDCSILDEYIPVEIHAWDKAGNHDFCQTFVQIMDNSEACQKANGGLGMIAGNIQTPVGKMVEEVSVYLTGGQVEQMSTDFDGAYSFEDLEKESFYEVKPFKDDDAGNGVSTFDLVMLQRHVLGASPIEDPYRLIAADVNGSNAVTTLDMIQLRKIILNVSDEFDSNTSWRFIDASYTFPNNKNPWQEPFPEKSTIEGVKDTMKIDFVAVKIGDVNGSALANTQDQNSESRSVEDFPLYTQEMALLKGNDYEIKIMVKELYRLLGMQGTFVYNSKMLKLIDLEYGIIDPTQMALFPETGQLTFSWNLEDTTVIMRDGPLITLHFRAKENTYLSENLALNSSLASAEAYTKEGDFMGLLLKVEGDPDIKFTKLYPPQPNPFYNETQVEYFLDKSQSVKFYLTDIQGRMIWQNELNQEKGLHRLYLNSNQFTTNGIYFLRMQSDKEVHTQKIVYQNR